MTTVRILVGDVREKLSELPDESVHCVVTSPPYWGLRNYGVDGQLGLEPTIELYVEHMVEVFREVRRVLRKDGTLWLNMGDCYATSPPGNKTTGLEKWKTSGLHGAATSPQYAATLDASVGKKRNTVAGALKPKDLVGQPWRVAFALQADGWWLRSDIIWTKPNPMPESIRDRPTKAHEYVFLLTKSARYFFDQEAVRERGISDYPASETKRGKGWHKHDADETRGAAQSTIKRDGVDRGHVTPSGGRNIRSVWTIPTQAFPEAHFATFPTRLVEPCIKAGTSEKGCCPECGASWVREAEVRYGKSPKHGTGSVVGRRAVSGQNNFDGAHMPRVSKHTRTVGWSPACDHEAKPVPCTVLDPFIGSGTTALVAAKLGRACIGVELNAEYAEMANRRLESTVPLLANVEVA